MLTKTFTFSEADLSFDQYHDYVIPNIRGLSRNYEAGIPSLPMEIYYVLIPTTAEITSIEIEPLESFELPEAY